MRPASFLSWPGWDDGPEAPPARRRPRPAQAPAPPATDHLLDRRRDPRAEPAPVNGRAGRMRTGGKGKGNDGRGQLVLVIRAAAVASAASSKARSTSSVSRRIRAAKLFERRRSSETTDSVSSATLARSILLPRSVAIIAFLLPGPDRTVLRVDHRPTELRPFPRMESSKKSGSVALFRTRMLIKRNRGEEIANNDTWTKTDCSHLPKGCLATPSSPRPSSRPTCSLRRGRRRPPARERSGHIAHLDPSSSGGRPPTQGRPRSGVGWVPRRVARLAAEASDLGTEPMPPVGFMSRVLGPNRPLADPPGRPPRRFRAPARLVALRSRRIGGATGERRDRRE